MPLNTELDHRTHHLVLLLFLSLLLTRQEGAQGLSAQGQTQWVFCECLLHWTMTSKITKNGDCSQEIKRRLLLGRKVMTNLDSIFKSRHHFTNKGWSSQSYGFSNSQVWMWELDYKAEHWRIDGFELWYWRRLLRVPWTARKSNQSIPKEISPEY